jgi:hypothetical protein
MEGLNLKKLNEIEGIEQFRVEVSNRFAAWGMTRENIKIVYVI